MSHELGMIMQNERKISQPIPILFHESYFTQFYGAQVGLFHLLQNLDRTQFLPLVVCPGEGVFTERIRKLGVEVVIVPLPPDLVAMGGKLLYSSLPQRFFQFGRLLPQVWQLSKLIKSRQVQLMHCNLTRSILSSGWAAKLTGIPLIWHVKGDKVGYLDDIAFVLSDRVISVSENVKEMLCRRWKSSGKVMTVRDGIPLERFDPSISGQAIRHEFGFTADHIVVGTVGSLGPRKCHHIFIEMAKIVAVQCPQARFLIVGDITHEGGLAYKQHLLSLGRDLIADGRLVLAGWRDDMPALYAAMDVFTLASTAEGLPLTVIEAMAMAKPIVSSMTLSANELVVNQKTGYIFPINDEFTMAAMVQKLVEDCKLRTCMGAAARERAASVFSVETMVQGIQKVYVDSLRRPTG